MPDKPKKEKAPKTPKVRASKYDKPLKIHGTFEQVIKALVKEPRPDYKPLKKKV